MDAHTLDSPILMQSKRQVQSPHEQIREMEKACEKQRHQERPMCGKLGISADFLCFPAIPQDATSILEHLGHSNEPTFMNMTGLHRRAQSLHKVPQLRPLNLCSLVDLPQMCPQQTNFPSPTCPALGAVL